MATKGTPYEGRDNVIAPRVYAGLSLGLYTNAADSLDASSVLGDLSQPVGSGYVLYPLNGVWSSADGVVTYDDGTPDDPVFENTHATNNWSAPIVGAFITDGTYLLHFMDAPDAPITMTPGKKLKVDLSTLVAP